MSGKTTELNDYGQVIASKASGEHGRVRAGVDHDKLFPFQAFLTPGQFAKGAAVCSRIAGLVRRYSYWCGLRMSVNARISRC